MAVNSGDGGEIRWFAMRDLKRPNAKTPAYRCLEEMGLEVFTPMRWTVKTQDGRRIRVKVPVLPDLLFVHSSVEIMTPIVGSIKTLQFRFSRGGYCRPLVVPEEEMVRFIRAVASSENPKYFLPGEVTPGMCGRTVRIIGGPLDGCEGSLLKVRGSRVHRLIVDLPNFLTVGVEVEPEYIQFIDAPASKSPAK